MRSHSVVKLWILRRILSTCAWLFKWNHTALKGNFIFSIYDITWLDVSNRNSEYSTTLKYFFIESQISTLRSFVGFSTLFSLVLGWKFIFSPLKGFKQFTHHYALPIPKANAKDNREYFLICQELPRYNKKTLNRHSVDGNSTLCQ